MAKKQSKLKKDNDWFRRQQSSAQQSSIQQSSAQQSSAQQSSAQTKSSNIQYTDLNFKHLYTVKPSNKEDEEISSVRLLIREKLNKYKEERV